ncbi:MAG: winged helix-turn-helix transcriptional regulator [Zoogloeaceae bacterium]|nr:winged helix-turn-helix transcriptional regulator [Rhodocyclaceae bacterium]MCP5254527.1 winged helix-turn-helix transcriptional regulator [Zoogloeaceae bacterium]
MDELNKVFENVAEYFGLLSEPTRLKILHCLCRGEKPVNEVVEALGLTQANTSRHLNLLYRAGVVDRRRSGSQVFYRIVDPNFVDLCRTVCVTVASRTSAMPAGSESLLRLENDLKIHR